MENNCREERPELKIHCKYFFRSPHSSKLRLWEQDQAFTSGLEEEEKRCAVCYGDLQDDSGEQHAHGCLAHTCSIKLCHNCIKAIIDSDASCPGCRLPVKHHKASQWDQVAVRLSQPQIWENPLATEQGLDVQGWDGVYVRRDSSDGEADDEEEDEDDEEDFAWDYEWALDADDEAEYAEWDEHEHETLSVYDTPPVPAEEGEAEDEAGSGGQDGRNFYFRGSPAELACMREAFLAVVRASAERRAE